MVALKADKGTIPDAVEEILVELGNPKQAIPYYAIYGPAVEEPIKIAGPLTQGQIADAITKVRGDVAIEPNQVARFNNAQQDVRLQH